MKYIKGYKIFESNDLSDINSEILDAMSGLSDQGYNIKIYDYYQDTSLFKNITNVKENTIKSKLVIIKSENNEVDPTQYLNVEDYSKMGFGDSGFFFRTDFNKIREMYTELIDSISQLEEYKPKLGFKDHTITVLLDISTVNQSDLSNKNDLSSEYDKLKSLLKSNDAFNKHTEIYSSHNGIKIKTRPRHGSHMMEIIASLCHQMSSDNRYNWINDYKKEKGLVNITKTINSDGYNITFENDDNDIILFLSKIK